jgi:hypothetical protein
MQADPATCCARAGDPQSSVTAGGMALQARRNCIDYVTRAQVHYGSMSKEAERLNGQLDAFKGDIKHEVRPLLTSTTFLCVCEVRGVREQVL